MAMTLGTAKSLLVSEYPFEAQFQPASLGSLSELYNLITGSPEIAASVINLVHQNFSALAANIDKFALITPELWSSLFLATWNEQKNHPGALQNNQVEAVFSDSSEASKILQTIAASCGLLAGAIDAVVAIAVGVCGIIGVISGGTAAVPAACVAAAIILFGILTAGALMGLGGILTIISIWI